MNRSPENTDIVIIGAGFSGLYAVHKLREKFSVVCFEAGDGVGGTWYWNRYPGARVDIESVEYSYGFDEELQQEWKWPEYFSAQPDLERYANHVADRFNLRKDIRLSNAIKSLRFDQKANRWHVHAKNGDHVICKYIVAATGALSAPNMPDWPGRERYQGEIYHTTEWPDGPLDLKDKRVRGKVKGGKLTPFEDRGQIDDGALAGQGLEIGWAQDYIDFFFLQIQGSGRLALPDGRVMRIGYAGQNGHDYTGIGRVMRERGLLADGKTNMQGIVEWLRANPEAGMKIMRENKSYVFFQELTGPGPLGAMGHPVVAQTSVATDRMFVPLGAPVFLDMEHDIADGLWIAQDTGGAIKGSNRFDTFWGAGEDAKRIAGGMASRGQALVFLPKGIFSKLTGQ